MGSRTRVGWVLVVAMVGVIGVVAPGGAVDKKVKVTEFSSGVIPGPFGITAGPDGNLWYTEYGDTAGGIGRITPAGKVTEFSAGLTAEVQPGGITTGPDGNLWFAENNERRIGRITPDGVISEFSPTTEGNSYPSDTDLGITAGPDGNLWYNAGGPIGRSTPDGVITEFDVGHNLLWGIPAAGPDGNLWIMGIGPNAIVRITPAGETTEFSAGLTVDTYASGLTAGPDGNLWFTEYNGQRIGRITPAGVITEFSAGLTGTPQGITAGPDGNLWFTEYHDNSSGPGVAAPATPGPIGRITPAGKVTEFSAGIAADAYPAGITVGCDGNLWFSEYDDETEAGVSQIGRITPKGKVTEFSAGITGAPSGITAGPDGNLWFTETQNGQIGRIDPGPSAKPRGKHGPTLPPACPGAPKS